MEGASHWFTVGSTFQAPVCGAWFCMFKTLIGIWVVRQVLASCTDTGVKMKAWLELTIYAGGEEPKEVLPKDLEAWDSQPAEDSYAIALAQFSTKASEVFSSPGKCAKG